MLLRDETLGIQPRIMTLISEGRVSRAVVPETWACFGTFAVGSISKDECVDVSGT